ncbi:protease HtpX [Actinobacteria bacterium YIM 96077]|uniref:Protease HtpX n=1 Tax=Phytoactinopolyspora halophila TaxID=1981511 RepID=A0A329QD93_9ACTN|nr:M48 family metalloprotease [Phytoactinopolyspora halophila]AYY14769.1 protease HtpX [Actinobacteria bacterium YIM 96077]RAW09679.1 protease HtpX [Phytoactinopolyspora halophila]
MLKIHVCRAWRNQLRAVVLLAVPASVLVLGGSIFGPVGISVALVLVVVFGGYAWVRGVAVAVRAMHAYPVGEAEQPELCRIVRDVTTRSRVPMPRVYVSPTPAVNAFAAGRHPDHAVICLTQGALDQLDVDELRSVIGHELAHIRHRDTVPACVAVALTRVAMAIPPAGVLMAAWARLAVSESREFEADREAARVIGEPLALARALRKLDAAGRALVLPTEPGVVAASHLMITSPLRSTGYWRLFRSHPSTAERIARLEHLAGYRR